MHESTWGSCIIMEDVNIHQGQDLGECLDINESESTAHTSKHAWTYSLRQIFIPTCAIMHGDGMVMGLEGVTRVGYTCVAI